MDFTPNPQILGGLAERDWRLGRHAFKGYCGGERWAPNLMTEPATETKTASTKTSKTYQSITTYPERQSITISKTMSWQYHTMPIYDMKIMWQCQGHDRMLEVCADGVFFFFNHFFYREYCVHCVFICICVMDGSLAVLNVLNPFETDSAMSIIRFVFESFWFILTCSFGSPRSHHRCLSMSFCKCRLRQKDLTASCSITKTLNILNICLNLNIFLYMDINSIRNQLPSSVQHIFTHEPFISIHVHGLLKPLENRNNIHEISWAYPSVNSGSSILWRVEQVVHRHGARTLWAPMDCWKATPKSEPEMPHFECRLAQVNNETTWNHMKPHETTGKSWTAYEITWNYVIKKRRESETYSV